jgi:5-formyltetrahydrofolate cyclo-ligase
MRARRKALTKPERDAAERAAAEKVEALAFFREAGTVAAYMALGSELDPEAIVREALRLGKKVALPVTVGRELIFRLVPDLDPGNFRLGAYGIREPREELPIWDLREEKEKVLWLIPGLAFDKECGRLGQGGGYYDKILKEIRSLEGPGQLCAGLAFDCQIAEKIPREPWDRAVDLVITPGNIFCNNRHILEE